jgi:hypothetical protein
VEPLRTSETLKKQALYSRSSDVDASSFNPPRQGSRNHIGSANDARSEDSEQAIVINLLDQISAAAHQAMSSGIILLLATLGLLHVLTSGIRVLRVIFDEVRREFRRMLREFRRWKPKTKLSSVPKNKRGQHRPPVRHSTSQRIAEFRVQHVVIQLSAQGYEVPQSPDIPTNRNSRFRRNHSTLSR